MVKVHLPEDVRVGGLTFDTGLPQNAQKVKK